MCAHWVVRRADLWPGDLVATLLSGTDGVYGTRGGMGGESARHWGDCGHADHRIPDRKNGQPLAHRLWLFSVRGSQPVVWRGESFDRPVDVLVGHSDQRIRFGLHFCSSGDDV